MNAFALSAGCGLLALASLCATAEDCAALRAEVETLRAQNSALEEQVVRLKSQPVSAVELLDRPALHSVENKPGLPAGLRALGEEAAALLIEVRAGDAARLAEYIDAVEQALAGVPTVEPVAFSTDASLCETYWKVRKGTFPAVGAMRRTGTTVLIVVVGATL